MFASPFMPMLDADVGDGCTRTALRGPRAQVAHVVGTYADDERLPFDTAAEDVAIFCLRSAAHQRARNRVDTITHLSQHPLTTENLRTFLARAATALPGADASLDDLMSADRSDATQAVQLALKARSMGVARFHAHVSGVAFRVARLASLLSGIPLAWETPVEVGTNGRVAA
jgi:hypothetical protein